MEQYKFNPEQAFNTISDHWKKWAAAHGVEKWVVGISGGKDSSVVAALAAKIFGIDKVLGVLMPNGDQKDIFDSVDVCEHLGIEWSAINIGEVYNALLKYVRDVLHNQEVHVVSQDTTTNMPPRLRMTALYAIAQSIPRAMVLNTSNRSENVVSFSTLYGDHAGSYAPIQDLTVTEVMQLGDWLGLPKNLVHKTPIDGLQPKTDEEKLGVTYADIDKVIREDKGSDSTKEKVWEYYKRGKFKLRMVQMEGPTFAYLPDVFRETEGL